ncbi:helix-turn-helix domain-containing protein [Acidithiobacillus ferrooxidans]|uniref:helix-turn-helix domain-containing protein n=1 Tax=Acidithiobacillus ferrooxidans TaxID=920 RepID=UPI001D02C34B
MESLRSLRKARLESLVDVAKEVGVAPSTISRIECGLIMPSLPLIRAIAKHFGVSIDDLCPYLGRRNLCEVNKR